MEGQPLRLGRTRTGQLSTLLGNIVQKTLPNATKHKTQIRAIAMGKEDMKLSLLTDDVIIRLLSQDNKI